MHVDSHFKAGKICMSTDVYLDAKKPGKNIDDRDMGDPESKK